MQYRDTPEQAAFRETVRAVIAKHLPDDLRQGQTLRASFDGRGWGRQRGPSWDDWRAQMADRGWVAPAWPTEYGGAGLSVIQQVIFNEEMTLARAPRIGGIGLGWAGPTILLYGTDEQKARFLPGILQGGDRWCQGFSEPGAGSDLASLQTRAVRDGDDYVINGQKIWTSGAQIADYCILLARTDADAPKHKGISYFLLDMKTPGVSVQPLVNMIGDADFNEVFFEDVRISRSGLLGEENRGWYIGTTTLDFERSNIAASTNLVLMVEELVAAVQRDADLPYSPAERDPGLRYELADRVVEANIARLMSYDVASRQSAGLVPNKEASIVKLFSGELEQRIAATGMRVLGLHGQLRSKKAPLQGMLARMYLGVVSTTIGGGTSEIQRNIVATRGIGLPRP